MTAVTLPLNVIEQLFADSDYLLSHKIGEGGFGSVFKAIYKKTDQYVAIKCLRLDPHESGKKRQRQIARFERESRIVSKLSHPNIVRLLDKGIIGESTVYSVFEYVEGVSLSEYLEVHGALDIEAAYAVMLQVASALVHAHEHGIIHRDIKPSNIMLSRTGTKPYVKLLDFGISTQMLSHRSADYQTLTLNQESLGTPTYCAPEQLRGEPATFSSDLYMWGLVFLECLSGVPAVSGNGVAEIYHQHLSESPISIPKALLTHPLGDLLRRVLQKRAHERTLSAQEVFEHLDTMVISNLVGSFQPEHCERQISGAALQDDQTIALRQDDSGHLPAHSAVSIQKKQITSLALRIVASGVDANSAQGDVVEAVYHSTRQQCIDIARRYAGFHVGDLSDMTLFYFGYPVASDHDARFAARTALDIIALANKQQAYIQQQHGCQFSFRLAIHSGIFLLKNNQVPDGFANHIVSELARQANDRSILCSGESKAILEPHYQFDESLQGASAGALGHELVAERVIEAFGFHRGVRNSHSLIGRSCELARLRAAVTEGSEGVVHLYGEAGIGKSRLLQELRQLEAARFHSQHVFQCLPEHRHNALFPVLDVIKNGLLKGSEDQAWQLTELIGHGQFTGPKAEITSILQAWLNIERTETCDLSSLDPSIQKALLFEGLAYFLGHIHQLSSQPVMYIFEDIHWADPTTLAFICYLNRQNIVGHRALITTSRQPAPHELGDNITSVVYLNHLSDGATTEFITALFDNTPVSEAVLAVLVDRTDGVPLFIEELVAMLKRHRFVAVEQGQVTFIEQARINDIPSTLRESIQNKIDGLRYARETLQLAATIGREFDDRLLHEASPFSAQQIQNDLAELLENELIIQQRQVSGDRYIFKHALVRDISYDSIHWQTRQELHELIAETMIASCEKPDRVAGYQIAQHYQHAEQAYSASWWYDYAASKAASIYAVAEAIELYQYALEHSLACSDDAGQPVLHRRILEGYSSSLSRDGQHQKARTLLIDLIAMLQVQGDGQALANAQLALGKAFEVVHQHAKALEHYRAALESLACCQPSGAPTQSPWWYVWLELQSAVLYVHYWLGNTEAMKDILLETEPVALGIADNRLLAKYYDDVLHLRMRDEQYVLGEDGIGIAQKALHFAERSGDQYLFAHALFSLGFCYCHIRQSAKAEHHMAKALDLAETYQDKVLQTRCCTYLAMNYRLTGKVQEARTFATQSIALAEETAMDDYIAASLANLSWCDYSDNNIERAIEYLDHSLDKWESLSQRYPFPFLWLSHLQVIVLCGENTDFSNRYNHVIANYSQVLLEKHQFMLPQEVNRCLSELVKANRHYCNGDRAELIKAIRSNKLI